MKPRTTGEPTVTIVIAVKNAERYIQAALTRIEAQTFRDFSVIIVNDGSTDRTAQICQEFESTFSLSLVTVPGGGVAEARNHGLSLARGRYIWFVDADDEWTDDALLLLHERAVSTGAGLVVARAYHRIESSDTARLMNGIKTDRVLTRTEIIAELLAGRVTGHLWNKLFERSLLGQAPFENLRSRSDFTGVIAVIGRLERAATITTPVYTYIGHAGSITNSGAATPGDLLRCGQVASTMLLSQPHAFGRADEFQYRRIVLPACGELFRFWQTIDDPKRMLNTVRQQITYRQLSTLLARGHFVTAWQAALVKVAPGLARTLFALTRLRRWRALR